MRALTLRSIKSPLELEHREPLSPGPEEVVIRLKSAALNRRDYWITQGLYPGVRTPVVLGSDGAGVVTQTGSELGNYWQGREVIINPGLHWGSSAAAQSDSFEVLGMPRDGTFADEIVIAASQLHERPSHLDWHQAASLGLAGLTAWRAVFSQGRLKADETVLITGVGGGVATFALQFAVSAGARVWVTSSSAEKIDRAVKLGAAGGFDYTRDDWSKQLLAASEPPQLIIDSAGGPQYRSLIGLVAAGGRIVNYGATAGAPESLDLFKVFWKQLTLQGSTMGSPADFAAMLKYVNEHRLVPAVDSVVPLEAGNEAIEQMKHSPQFGKIALAIEA